MLPIAGSEFLSVLQLRRFPNGGWVIEKPGSVGEMLEPVGAYTDCADMLSDLASKLADFEKKSAA